MNECVEWRHWNGRYNLFSQGVHRKVELRKVSQGLQTKYRYSDDERSRSRLLHSAEKIPRNNNTLNLTRSLVDLEDFCISHQLQYRFDWQYYCLVKDVEKNQQWTCPLSIFGIGGCEMIIQGRVAKRVAKNFELIEKVGEKFGKLVSKLWISKVQTKGESQKTAKNLRRVLELTC